MFSGVVCTAIWINYYGKRGDNWDVLIIFIIVISNLIVYPIVGIFVVRICELLRKWAYKTNEGWSERKRMFFIAMFPFTLLISLAKYLPLGIINRIS